MTRHLTLPATALHYRTTYFLDLRTLIRGESMLVNIMSGGSLEMKDKGKFRDTYSIQVFIEINFSWRLVQLGLDEHYKILNDVKQRTANINGEIACNSQDFLSIAVQYPWARAISQNKVPYYIK